MKRFEELQDRYDALSNDDKDFVSWLAVAYLVQQWRSERDKAEKEITKETYWKDVRYVESLSKEIETLNTIQFTLAQKIF